MFFDIHNLEKGKVRFDPDYNIAQSFQRLREGKNIKEQDIILLLHEKTEKYYMDNGDDYIVAHKKANKKYNYEKIINEIYGV